MRAGLEIYIKQENWGYAARLASNLSEVKLTLGDAAGAVADGEQSVTYADRSDDALLPEVTRTTHADALHHAGGWAKAEARFTSRGPAGQAPARIQAAVCAVGLPVLRPAPRRPRARRMATDSPFILRP